MNIKLNNYFNILLIMHVIAVFFTPYTLLWASQKPSPAELAGFDRLEENTIIFNAPSGVTPPKPLKTGLFDLAYLGTLRPQEGGEPYFLFTGKSCQNCLEDRAIYAIRPTGGKQNSFVYPGKILDPKNRSMILESRAFYGRCLPRHKDIFVVFQKEKVDRRHGLQSSVFVAEAGKAYLEENLMERHLPSIKTTLQYVKKKSCHEIEGRNRLMLSKPLDLHPHANTDNNDDDDDDDKASSKKEQS